MIKLCIFDLDGTVLDTLETIAHYGNFALGKNGIDGIAVESYKYLAGNGAKKLVKNMLELQKCYTDERYEKVYEDYNRAYDANVAFKTKAFEGMKETLEAMKNNGIALAVVSNKPNFATVEVINEIFGVGYFDFVYGQREGVPLKPDPTVVLDIISSVGVQKHECLYIGDTATDMKTGKNAGLYTIGVLWGFRDESELLENGADKIIKKPCELIECIKNAV